MGKVEDVESMQKPPKQKRCKSCRELFTPFRPMQVACSMGCAQSLATVKREKEERKKAQIERAEYRKAKEEARPLKWYEDRAQDAINAYVVKVRDKDDGCISCGTRNPNIVYAAGHFRTRGAASQLRYNLDNIHKQCNYHCNSKLGGNILHYRPALIAKIGQERFDALINNNETKRWTIEELNEITETYRKKVRYNEK